MTVREKINPHLKLLKWLSKAFVRDLALALVDVSDYELRKVGYQFVRKLTLTLAKIERGDVRKDYLTQFKLSLEVLNRLSELPYDLLWELIKPERVKEDESGSTENIGVVSANQG